MNTRKEEKFQLIRRDVFGKYSESYYGELKRLNPTITVPGVITGIINTTAYNRIPVLYERLFAWIDSVNATTSDIPLEVVIIGVGNNAYLNTESNKIYNQSSPQIIEVLVALTAIK